MLFVRNALGKMGQRQDERTEIPSRYKREMRAHTLAIVYATRTRNALAGKSLRGNLPHGKTIPKIT